MTRVSLDSEMDDARIASKTFNEPTPWQNEHKARNHRPWLGLSGIASRLSAAEPAKPAAKLKILILLVDDLGDLDIGFFGSEVKTPNIDRLAVYGMEFSQIYNTAKCYPTRASLQGGVYFQRMDRNPPPGTPWAEFLNRPNNVILSSSQAMAVAVPVDQYLKCCVIISHDWLNDSVTIFGQFAVGCILVIAAAWVLNCQQTTTRSAGDSGYAPAYDIYSSRMEK